jgi:hypothetical protein
MDRFKISFEPEMLTRLRAEAEARGISVALLVRMIVDQFFQRKDKQNERTTSETNTTQ